MLENFSQKTSFFTYFCSKNKKPNKNNGFPEKAADNWQEYSTFKAFDPKTDDLLQWQEEFIHYRANELGQKINEFKTQIAKLEQKIFSLEDKIFNAESEKRLER